MEYGQPGHPESRERVESSYEFLKSKGYEFIEPSPAKEQDLLLVHTEDLVNNVRNGTFFDLDTPKLPGIYAYAKLSAGAAIKAMELCLKGEFVFSLMRPPGHHATKDSVMGFCYFNNIAIAVKKALKSMKVENAAIIDIDVHHGNGTQNIFLGDKKVLYVSLHQYGSFYPGTGGNSELNCLNYPLKAGTKEREYLEKLKDALENVEKFSPGLVGISAGFDTYEEDPLAGLFLETETYRKIAKMISDLSKPTFAVLEGGYSTKLHECVYQFLKGF